ncbi:MAG: IS110 family transposase [Fibromonadaceae bacterium]|jgi:transposase|nr:IS110 family transposase [Fibromonadaceae bacterium]
MNVKKKVYVGIDISKDTFNAHCNGVDVKYSNNRKGWRVLLKNTPPNAIYTMEATGNYHYQMAKFLCKNGALVRIFNPLFVRRYMQSLGNKVKTDKKDARLIAGYAETKSAQIEFWQPLPLKHARAMVIVSLLSGLSKLERSAGNMKTSAALVAGKSDKALAAMSSVKSICKEQQKALEKELYDLVKEIFPEQFRLSKTIPGIGAKTAATLLVRCKGLEPFATHKQLTSFIGLDPTIFESGTSIKGNGKISKTGNPYLRGLLFMCASSAIQLNRTPMAKMYKRLTEKGKPKMLALTAVMHRLVKIAFGVVKSGEPYRG